MPKNKTNYSAMTVDELENKIADEKAMLTKLKFNHSISQIENPVSIRLIRRNIAQMATALTTKTNQ
jgi:large subunit ribosomal protein L29